MPNGSASPRSSAACWREGIANGSLRADLDTRIAAEALLGMLRGINRYCRDYTTPEAAVPIVTGHLHRRLRRHPPFARSETAGSKPVTLNRRWQQPTVGQKHSAQLPQSQTAAGAPILMLLEHTAGSRDCSCESSGAFKNASLVPWLSFDSQERNVGVGLTPTDGSHPPVAAALVP